MKNTLKFLSFTILMIVFTACTTSYDKQTPTTLESQIGKISIDTTQYTKAYIKSTETGVIVVTKDNVKQLYLYDIGQLVILWISIVMLVFLCAMFATRER